MCTLIRHEIDSFYHHLCAKNVKMTEENLGVKSFVQYIEVEIFTWKVTRQTFLLSLFLQLFLNHFYSIKK